MTEDKKYILLPKKEYERLSALLAKLESGIGETKPFPKTGPVGVGQITTFLKMSRSAWWDKVKSEKIEPIPGFQNPRKWRAEDIWKLCGYDGGEAA